MLGGVVRPHEWSCRAYCRADLTSLLLLQSHPVLLFVVVVVVLMFVDFGASLVGSNIIFS